MGRFAATCAGAFALSFIPAHAQNNWTTIGAGGGTKLSIDMSTVRDIGGGLKSAWFKFQHTPPKAGVSYTLEMDRVNCDSDSTATVSWVSYDPSGEVTASRTTAIPLLKWEPAPPGTFAATMVRVACFGVPTE